MKRNVLLVFGLSICLLKVSQAQVTNTKMLEPLIKKGIDKAYAASVRMMGYDTVKNVQNSSQFSGVVVDKDGTILTVSHAIQPGKLYKVFFPDGRQAMAKALGKIGIDQQKRPDLGMMRLVTKGDWPVAEMGWSYSVKVNEPCISIAYPETLNQLFPTIRFGRITDLMNKWQFLESTCKMEPGDSGGPLFDYQGRLIGLHSRCLEDEDGNYEVPIDLYRTYWKALNVPEDYTKLPADTSRVGEDPLAKEVISLPFIADLEKTLSATFETNKKYVLVVKSKSESKEGNVYTTVFEQDGKFYLVGKSSLISDQVTVSWKGKPIVVKVLARDKSNDLVLLSIPKKIGEGISLSSIATAMDLSKADLGTVMVSPLASAQRVGVLSSEDFELPNRYSSAYLGASAMFDNGHAVITKVNPSGSAMASGILTGDKVLEIGNNPITSASVYNAEMLKYMAGDTVIFKIKRDDSIQVKSIITGSWPLPNHTAEKFSGGKSIRRDGFSKVFAHDAIIQADECGGPVFDQNGRFYGVNIARFSRTAVIAVSPQVLYTFIKQYIGK
ncbi:trypsin-like peptidase domain-containing protein [Pedobacter sp. MW01-1-1]|uniref:trypsin-like peptidase domain-containing protein n=1 Tax=Pedobacter sp. MW01-1-1 TaxID=3383027 RepID=UPI003FEFAACC